jgi:Flp pilus assembly pilin Flp
MRRRTVIEPLAAWAVQDDAQDLIEYGMLAALIAVLAIVAVSAVGTTVNTLFWQTFANAM